MSVYFHDILTIYRYSANGFKSSTFCHIQTQIITLQGLSVLIGKESYNLLSNGKHKMCDIQWAPQHIPKDSLLQIDSDS